jgi:hypothetical protein
MFAPNIQKDCNKKRGDKKKSPLNIKTLLSVSVRQGKYTTS